MKVSVIIPIFKRHDLTKVVFTHLKKQQQKFGFKVIVAGSEGKISRDLTRGFGFAYIEVPNLPVSNKNNQLIKASKDLDSDLVCLIGSDDFVEDKYFEWVNTLDSTKEVFYGINDLYYYSTKSRNLMYFKGYGGANQSIGAGRVFTKALLKKMNYKLWDGYKNKGLDSNCSTFVRSKGYKEMVCRDTGIFLLDVKHAYNITSHLIMNTGKAESKHLIQAKLGTETFKSISSMKYIEGNDIIKLPKNKKNAIMDNKKVTIEIIEEKAGMKIGSKRRVSGNIAKALIQRGIAKVAEKAEKKAAKKAEPKKEEVAAEPTKEASNDSLTLTELRAKYPDIKATSKNVFLKKIEDANTK